tara:strand:- start:467 stop:1633 length:1167 start_codon:yes stop_codon:yes gene_type:complete
MKPLVQRIPSEYRRVMVTVHQRSASIERQRMLAEAALAIEGAASDEEAVQRLRLLPKTERMAMQVCEWLTSRGGLGRSDVIPMVMDALSSFYYRDGRVVQYEAEQAAQLWRAVVAEGFTQTEGDIYKMLSRLKRPVCLTAPAFTVAPGAAMSHASSYTYVPFDYEDGLPQRVLFMVEVDHGDEGSEVMVNLIDMHHDEGRAYLSSDFMQAMYGQGNHDTDRQPIDEDGLQRLARTTAETWQTAVPLLLPVVDEVVEYYRPRRRKGKRRRGLSARTYYPEGQLVKRVMLDKAVGFRRKAERSLSDPPRKPGRNLNPGSYNGPGYWVGDYTRRIWVYERNVRPGEEWLDIKQARNGELLVQVERECNRKGYRVGDCTTRVERVIGHEDLL